MNLTPRKVHDFIGSLVKLVKKDVSLKNDSFVAFVNGKLKRLSMGAPRMDKRVDIALEDVRQRSTSPVKDTVGSNSPVLQGWLFDADTKKLQFSLPIPNDYTEGKIKLHLVQALANNETDQDVIDWQSVYVIGRENDVAGGNGVAADDTATTITGSTTVQLGGGSGVDAGKVYDTVLEMDPADADNPFDDSGDYYVFADINRLNVGNSGKVDSTLLIYAFLEYV